MEINSLSGTSLLGYTKSIDSVNRLDHVNQIKLKRIVRSEENEESSSLKLSVAGHKSLLSSMNRKVVFDIDPETKDVIIKLFNEKTGEETLQIPSEDVLRLSKRISEFQGKTLSFG